jgi:hypothetical protein
MMQVIRTRTLKTVVIDSDGQDLLVSEAKREAIAVTGTGWVLVDWDRLNYDRVQVTLEEAA